MDLRESVPTALEAAALGDHQGSLLGHVALDLATPRAAGSWMTSQPQTIDLGFVNAYLLAIEDGFILVDTGMRNQRARLEKALAMAGCTPGRLRLIVATHGDIDHTANCAYLRTEFRAPVAMHAGDASMVEQADWPKRKVTSSSLRLMHTIMRLTGVTRRMGAGFERFTPDFELVEGQSLESHGLAATVLHIPGHTPGSVALALADGGLICGDTVENRGGLHPTRIVDEEAQLHASLERLLALDLGTVHPGHGSPFSWEQFRPAYERHRRTEA